MKPEILLPLTLEVGVPLAIYRLQGMTFEERQKLAREASQVIAEKGDLLLYKSKKPGETGDVVNHLITGVACLAFMPGGVRAFGRHWEVRDASEEEAQMADERSGPTDGDADDRVLAVRDVGSSGEPGGDEHSSLGPRLLRRLRNYGG